MNKKGCLLKRMISW